jgi:hypothetical protein
MCVCNTNTQISLFTSANRNTASASCEGVMLPRKLVPSKAIASARKAKEPASARMASHQFLRFAS